MLVSDEQLARIKHSYQTLGVPSTASAPAIKQAYRRLVKRWHPDLYVTGTHAHAEATQMSEHINAAYSVIANAPLRYLAETRASAMATRPQSPARESAQHLQEHAGVDEQTFLTVARIEFVVRFVCGAGFGFLICLCVAFYALADVTWDLPPLIPVALGITVASGYASARLGDRFWYWIFRRWWLES